MVAVRQGGVYILQRYLRVPFCTAALPAVAPRRAEHKRGCAAHAHCASTAYARLRTLDDTDGNA